GRIGTEHQVLGPVDESAVEMGHRHRRCADRRLPVDLCVVAGDDLGIGTAEEGGPDGEYGVATDLRKARSLEQPQRRTPCSDEHPSSAQFESAVGRASGDEPATVRRAVEGTHLVLEQYLP